MKIHDFKRYKTQQKKITMLTCYDYPSAQVIADSNLDCVLVGDSVAMVVHGYPTTLSATIEMMEMHTAAVSKGLGKQFLISDLPFLTYRATLSETIQHVKRLMQAGAHAIKLEGADDHALETITHLVQSGVPIMGHIGLTPQAVHQLGGFKIQGKKEEDATKILQQAIALEKAGCFALVLECIPQKLAQDISRTLEIPTIGIGAGTHTDGQVLVWHDMLGLQTNFLPKFSKQFMNGKDLLVDGVQSYCEQVEQMTFPAQEHVF